ncbi:MAG: hypothetical protein AVDCRST_MAG01-01-40, partial [uncultured Rubrobacteraceae bacterium]
GGGPGRRHLRLRVRGVLRDGPVEGLLPHEEAQGGRARARGETWPVEFLLLEPCRRPRPARRDRRPPEPGHGGQRCL